MRPDSLVNIIGKIMSKDVKIPINVDNKKITSAKPC